MASQVYIHWTLLGITFGFATIAILLRVLSRVLTRLKFWWDDWLAITCYVRSTATRCFDIGPGNSQVAVT